ncbi:MAG: universal stress protein [Pseudohongiella sp.]|nr:universal stress protein [Pseudohongiella sp.]
MQTIENILVVIDPTVDRDFVVDRAKLVAKACKARITLFINNENSLTDHSYVYEGMDGDFFEQQRQLFEQHYKKLLADLSDEFGKEEIEVNSVFAEHHHLAEAIIKQTKALKPDLVMKSTHTHNVIERSLVTNTDWRLIRKCPADLLLVKPNGWQDEGAVVTAVDPFHRKAVQTHLDHSLLEHTELFADILQQSPYVFHSYFPFVSTMFPLGSESTIGLEKMRHKHEVKIKQLLQDHNIAEDNIELSYGEIVPHLVNYLKSVKANILVIGALSRNVLERAIVGNTAEKILEDCPCDVLVIKPAKK